MLTKIRVETKVAFIFFHQNQFPIQRDEGATNDAGESVPSYLSKWRLKNFERRLTKQKDLKMMFVYN